MTCSAIYGQKCKLRQIKNYLLWFDIIEQLKLTYLLELWAAQVGQAVQAVQVEAAAQADLHHPLGQDQAYLELVLQCNLQFHGTQSFLKFLHNPIHEPKKEKIQLPIVVPKLDLGKEYVERRHCKPIKFLFLPNMGLSGSQVGCQAMKKNQF